MKRNNFLLNNDYNIIFSGGGFKGFYSIGISNMLNNIKYRNRIKKIIGSSSGSFTAVYMACDIELNKHILTYEEIKKLINNKKTILEASKIVSDNLLPKNAHELCNQRNVEIYTTEISLSGIKLKIFKNFQSREELLNCICASICIPFFTHNNLIKINNKYYCDPGFIGYNNPIEHNCDNDQMIIYNYLSPGNIFKPTEKDIKKIIFIGYDNFLTFLNNIDNTTLHKKLYMELIPKNTNTHINSKLLIIFNNSILLSLIILFFFFKYKFFL